MKQNRSSEIFIWIISSIVCVGVFIAYFTLTNGMISRNSPSDYPSHIDAALAGHGYSLMSIIICAVMKIFNSNEVLTGVMTLIQIITIIGITWLLKVTIEVVSKVKIKFVYLIIIAASTIFLTNMYIPEYWPHYYVSQTSLTQPWHNSTYLLMRMFAVYLMSVFILVQKNYTCKMKASLLILFTILLILVNWAKPNFIIAFAPAVLVMLIWDFIQTKTKSFIPALIIGLCVLISLAIVIVQYTIAFPGDGESGVAFFLDKFHEFAVWPKAFWSIVSNLAFAIYVLVICIVCNIRKMQINLRVLVLSWIMFLISRFEAVFFTETGIRAFDGNFAWGQYYFTFQLYVISVAYLIALYKNKNIKWLSYIGWGIYLLNVLSGLIYFKTLLTGAWYII